MTYRGCFVEWKCRTVLPLVSVTKRKTEKIRVQVSVFSQKIIDYAVLGFKLGEEEWRGFLGYGFHLWKTRIFISQGEISQLIFVKIVEVPFNIGMIPPLPRWNPGSHILMYQIRHGGETPRHKHTWESLKTARRTMLPERACKLNLQSMSDPGNIMLAWRNVLDGKSSHPRHLSFVNSSSKDSSSTMFFGSGQGIAISSSFFLLFLFATQT